MSSGRERGQPFVTVSLLPDTKKMSLKTTTQASYNRATASALPVS